jgi:hypothetical protein
MNHLGQLSYPNNKYQRGEVVGTALDDLVERHPVHTLFDEVVLLLVFAITGRVLLGPLDG